MIIEDKFVISSPIDEVWDFFLDIPTVSRCLPGVEKVDQVDDDTFGGVLKVKVGPIAANFAGQVRLTELEAPRRLVARAEGKDQRTASMVSATFVAMLDEVVPGETEVTYQIDTTIRGRLGQFGQGVIRETAKQMTQAFATCVQEQLVSTEVASSGERQVQPATTPSVVSIVLSAIGASIANTLRSLWARIAPPIRGE